MHTYSAMPPSLVYHGDSRTVEGWAAKHCGASSTLPLLPDALAWKRRYIVIDIGMQR